MPFIDYSSKPSTKPAFQVIWSITANSVFNASITIEDWQYSLNYANFKAIKFCVIQGLAYKSKIPMYIIMAQTEPYCLLNHQQVAVSL